ncbi:hypothetical protein LNTAR_24848 [Lentisphaera araneosa HTCC2155]|jgi:hypothetical protein|uniref:Uncharacterized protein n=2 Tax=Lentisphaera TaxID=256846 RepID=A6DSX7_9BACT|nr:hypothetical protein LNTAR_24848 [Lentisphaera araneosa HTCC2155]
MFPEECGNLILNPAPFVTMKEEAKILDNIKNEDWVKLFLNVDNPNESIIIGWFGYGADTALIVDCSNDDYEVKKYVFNRYWKSLGTYSEFHNLLKLDKVKFKKFE